MNLLTQIVIGFVAIFHLYIMWFEMYAWTTKGPKVFGRKKDNYYEETKVLAKNQGLYNGFLAAGLIWTFFISDLFWKYNISLFFLTCVLVAGIYGSLTASKKIIYVQGLPAFLGILLIIIYRYFW